MVETMKHENIWWQAIVARSTEFDGKIYYGVKSTGVFCRPSCSSRQPKRENVTFFSLPEAAQQAGFRACRRCQPEKTEIVDKQALLVKNVCRAIEDESVETINLALLGEHFGISPTYLQKVFKKLMGITPHEYLRSIRVRKFKNELKKGENITNAIYDAGFNSSSRLYENSAAELGMTPATYGKRGKGMKINFTVADSPLGFLLVAQTERGICSVALGERESELIEKLNEEFAEAEISRDDESLGENVGEIIKNMAGKQPHLDLPLDVRATAFQRLVWEELRKIPYGETASYGEIARRIGQPTATRAVARACATNPTALITPCHRVVRENGDLSGYRWGIERKKVLLENEKQNSRKS